MLTMACSESLLCAQHKFNYSITGLRKAERMSMTMLVLVARARREREVADNVGISFGTC